MRLSLRANNSRLGFTLVELMIASAATVLILSSLCGVYFAVIREWQRQQGEGDALIASTRACSRIADYASVAVGAAVFTRITASDTLALNLPADTAYGGLYVPTWNGGKMQFRSGIWIAIYLSDSTGNINRTGSILWAGTVTWSGSTINVVPDRSWSLYYDRDIGRVAPLKSIRFALDETGDKPAVTVTAVAAYKTGNTEKQLSRSRTICLVNAP